MLLGICIKFLINQKAIISAYPVSTMVGFTAENVILAFITAMFKVVKLSKLHQNTKRLSVYPPETADS